jgi:hypothetical protein
MGCIKLGEGRYRVHLPRSAVTGRYLVGEELEKYYRRIKSVEEPLMDVYEEIEMDYLEGRISYREAQEAYAELEEMGY